MYQNGTPLTELLLLRSVRTEKALRVTYCHAEAEVCSGLSIFGVIVVVHIKLWTITPEEVHTIRTVRAKEPSVRYVEVVIELDTLWNGVSSLQDVDVVAGSVRLQYRLHDPVGIEPFLPRDMKGLWHDRNLQATIVRVAHDLDTGVLQCSFRQV